MPRSESRRLTAQKAWKDRIGPSAGESGDEPHLVLLRCASYELAVLLFGRRSHVAPQRHSRRRCPSSVLPWFTHLCLRKRHRSGFPIASPPENHWFRGGIKRRRLR